MKYNLERFQGNRRVVEVADGATKGATVGVDLFYNGVLVLWEDIYNGGGTTPATPGTTITAWSLILDIPANVTALADTSTTGLYVITGSGTSATREIQPAVGRTTVSNGDGIAGDPVIDLAVVVDSGVGAALMKRTIDGFGRVTGSQAATTSDLAEGTNLYFTVARVRATALAGLSLVTATAITAADTVLSAFGKLQAQITALATSLTGYVPTTRTIGTTAPLAGGGDLSADRTLSITAATTGAAGSMSAADKTKLNGIATGATAYTDAAARAAVITATITNGDTTHSPSGDAVFDALATKANDSGVVHIAGTETITGTKTFTQDVSIDSTSGSVIFKSGGSDTGQIRNNSSGITVVSGTLSAYMRPLGTSDSTNELKVTASEFSIGSIIENRTSGSSVYSGAPSGSVYAIGDAAALPGANSWMRIAATSTNPGVDNTRSMGTSGTRWSVVYAATGAINTSDAREKTEVVPLTGPELAAAKDLSAAIGTYQWLESVADKGGGGARHHAGLTVQRAIEIMRAHQLDPMRYGFICYDEWSELPELWDEWDQETDDEGNVTKQAGRALVQESSEAGDRYSFRYDELLMFIARGIDARLSALENKTN